MTLAVILTLLTNLIPRVGIVPWHRVHANPAVDLRLCAYMLSLHTFPAQNCQCLCKQLLLTW